MRNFLTTFCYFMKMPRRNGANNVSWLLFISTHTPTVSGLTDHRFLMTTNFTNQIINGDFSSGNTDFSSTTALLWEVHGALERSLNLRHPAKYTYLSTFKNVKNGLFADNAVLAISAQSRC